MIKPVDEIPKGLSKKHSSYREMIRADIQEALDRGIARFEFVGDYKYKYLAQYAREEADKLMKEQYNAVVRAHRNEWAGKTAALDWWSVKEKARYITVSAYREKREAEPRVFCEIRPGKPEEILLEAIREYLAEKEERRRLRDEKMEKRAAERAYWERVNSAQAEDEPLVRLKERRGEETDEG